MHHTRSPLLVPLRLRQIALTLVLTCLQSSDLALQCFLLNVVLMYVGVLVHLIAAVLHAQRVCYELFVGLLFEILSVPGYLLLVKCLDHVGTVVRSKCLDGLH